MQLPTEEVVSETPDNNPQTQNTSTSARFSFSKLSKNQRIILAGSTVFVTLLALMIILLVSSGSNSKNSDGTTSNPQDKLAEAKKNQTTKEQKEASASSPINQLQSIYKEVIVAESLKRKLEISSSGIANVEYTVPSTDGQIVIKTSYENFADMAFRVFNISGVNRFNVATYTNKFTDQFGQPNQVALKLQVTKETSAKINWPLKKYSYKDYATILDHHELNPLLQKDYESLTKNK